jgi:hypothetical protein
MGIEAVPSQLRLDGKSIAGEAGRLDQDLSAPLLRPIEAREQQVQVHRESVHHRDLVPPAAHQPRQGIEPPLVEPVPGLRLFEPSVDAGTSPPVELGADVLPRGCRQRAERVADQVDQRLTGGPARYLEPIPEPGERIRQVE